MQVFIILLAIILIVILAINKQRIILIFWTVIFFIANPGGITNQLLGKGSLIGGIFYFDILIIIIFILLILGGYRFNQFFINKSAKSVFYILLIFMLYKIFIWGFIVPEKSIHEFLRYTLLRERGSILGFLVVIPVYIIAMQDLKTFLKIIIILSFSILILSFSSFIFGWNIINIASAERYQGSGIIRYHLYNYGLLLFLIPSFITVYVARLKIKHRKILLFGAILSIISIIVTLTKNQYLFLIGMIFSSSYYSAKILQLKISKSILKVFSYGIIISIILSLALPKYIGYASMAVNDIYLLITSGVTSDGSTSRMWQIPAFTYEIKRNPLFGTGHGYDQLNNQKFAPQQFDATDLPFLAHIMP